MEYADIQEQVERHVMEMTQKTTEAERTESYDEMLGNAGIHRLW